MSKVKLGDYIETFGDGIHGTPVYDENGEYFFINGNNLIDGEITIDENTLRISKTEYEKIKRPLGENTLLLSINGTLGRVAEYKNEKIALGKSVCFLNIKDNVNKDFVRYVMLTQEFQKYILLVAHGSTIKNLAPSQVAEYEFSIPDILDVNRMADLLKAIDNKIKNNNKINAELESMAKTIYDYWFLQFEFPNEDGKPYKSSGGKMVWNEELKREIPEGWEVLKVGNISKSNRGVSYTSNDLDNNGTPMLTLGCANKDGSFNFDGIQHYVGGYSGNKELLPYDLIIYNTDMSSACYVVGRTILVPAIFNKVISSHHLTTIHFDNDNYKWYFYQLSQTDYFRKYIIGFSTGSNVKGLDYSGIENFSHEFPNDAILTKFVDILRPIHEKISKIMLENQELVSLRDFLLPMLMNGQIGFKDKK